MYKSVPKIIRAISVAEYKLVLEIPVPGCISMPQATKIARHAQTANLIGQLKSSADESSRWGLHLNTVFGRWEALVCLLHVSAKGFFW